jgi:hypothetical protein
MSLALIVSLVVIVTAVVVGAIGAAIDRSAEL